MESQFVDSILCGHPSSPKEFCRPPRVCTAYRRRPISVGGTNLTEELKRQAPIALMIALAISIVPTAVGSSRWGFMS